MFFILPSSAIFPDRSKNPLLCDSCNLNNVLRSHKITHCMQQKNNNHRTENLVRLNSMAFSFSFCFVDLLLCIPLWMCRPSHHNFSSNSKNDLSRYLKCDELYRQRVCVCVWKYIHLKRLFNAFFSRNRSRPPILRKSKSSTKLNINLIHSI